MSDDDDGGIDWDEAILLLDKLQEIPDIEDAPAMRYGHVLRSTLYDRYRAKRGWLSVTDLTAPGGWCEVQYAYSLAGRRDLKPEKRPERIVTESGKEIKVDKKIAVANEKILQKGRDVHQALEREVHPETKIETESEADRWGVRIVEQITSLATLTATGKTREIPVFGFFKQHFILGKMDEIEQRSIRKDVEESDPAKISHYLHRSLGKNGLFLVDSKTRRTPTLPAEHHTVASRFQLMLYKYLFDVHASGKFDYRRFSQHLGELAVEPFSSIFTQHLQGFAATPGLEKVTKARTVSELAEILEEMHVQVGPLQDTLQLVYRWREPTTQNLTKQKNKVRKKTRKATDKKGEVDPIAPNGIIDLTNAAESTRQSEVILLSDDEGESHGMDNAPVQADSTSQKAGDTVAASSADVHSDIQSTTIATDMNAEGPLLTPRSSPINLSENIENADAVQDAIAGTIIGTHDFEYDESELFTYLDAALGFWTGRPPEGVKIDETNKCRSCEFQDGCEWLAMKAEEQSAIARSRRLATTPLQDAFAPGNDPLKHNWP